MYKSIFKEDCPFFDGLRVRKREPAPKPKSIVVLVRNPFEILLHKLDGQIVTIEIGQENTIEELKRCIEVKYDIPPEQQRLIFNGRELKNEITIQDYNIVHHSRVHLILRLTGC
jgi:ubiquitin C